MTLVSQEKCRLTFCAKSALFYATDRIMGSLIMKSWLTEYKFLLEV
jgi:hypothetical protein